MSLTSDSPVTVTNRSDRKNLLGRIAELVRQSPEPELQDILTATATEVRLFLGTDRVKIYQFQADGSGKIIAEAVDETRLPSLLGLNFPADDIPEYARELFVKSRMRSIVDVSRQQIGQSLQLDSESENRQFDRICYRSVDPCHTEYLTAMGVKSSLVMPILQTDGLWGLLVSHHSEPRTILEEELHDLQIVVEQLNMAIAQANLLAVTRERGQREAIVNHINHFLHTITAIDLQTALEETVKAFQGSGGRLYFRTDVIDDRNGLNTGPSSDDSINTESAKLLTCGSGPVMPDQAMYPMMEQYSAWGRYFSREDRSVWAMADLYKTPELRNLQVAFQPTRIRGILTVFLRYGNRAIGYLSVFRDEIETEKLWAGEFDPDRRQQYPRQSFEVWKQSLASQAPAWTDGDLQLAQTLAKQFASAIVQDAMHRQVQTLNTTLERQVQERTAKWQQATKQQQVLYEVVTKIRQSLDVETIFKTTTDEVCRLLQADRVVIYRFNPDWSGEFVAESVVPGWNCLMTEQYRQPQLSENVNECSVKELLEAQKLDDSYLQETQGGTFAKGQTYRVCEDIYEAGFSECYIKVLEICQARAYAIVAIYLGSQLWGLLAVYQNGSSRCWHDSEIQFIEQIAVQIGIALQQTNLLEQTQQQAASLQQAAEQQRVLFDVVAKIRESLDLDTIFTTMSREVRRALKTDRVGIYRFDPNSEFNEGEFVAEDVSPEFPAALGAKVRDRCFGDNYATKYSQGRVSAMADVRSAGLKPCYVQILAQFGIQANMIAPILKGEQLWGLLCIHQCSQPRNWEESEIQFATQIAAQVSVALEQSKLLDRTRQQAEQLSQMLEELRETQTQLIQSEKMSSLGQLVAGVAHEINNPVNFIYGNLVHTREYTTDLLDLVNLYQQHCTEIHPEIAERIEEVEPDYLAQDLPKMFASMKVGVDRIRQIVLSLLSFSHLDRADLKAVDLHEGLDSTLLILQHRLKAKSDRPEIEVVKEYGDLPPVECYAGQLNQVFMNLLSNAIDTIEQRQKSRDEPYLGRILLRTSVETKPDSKTPVAAIELGDNGMGIPESVRQKIFDPFFTTKPVGKGTGLGLSISYQIVVDKHGGNFSCISKPEMGTKFRIEIPIERID